MRIDRGHRLVDKLARLIDRQGSRRTRQARQDKARGIANTKPRRVSGWSFGIGVLVRVDEVRVQSAVSSPTGQAGPTGSVGSAGRSAGPEHSCLHCHIGPIPPLRRSDHGHEGVTDLQHIGGESLTRWKDVGDRVRQKINHRSGRIAQGGGAGERNFQEGPFGHAPDMQRLAKVRGPVRQAKGGRSIKNAKPTPMVRLVASRKVFVAASSMFNCNTLFTMSPGRSSVLARLPMTRLAGSGTEAPKPLEAGPTIARSIWRLKAWTLRLVLSKGSLIVSGPGTVEAQADRKHAVSTASATRATPVAAEDVM
jgi:hypothetical protein